MWWRDFFCYFFLGFPLTNLSQSKMTSVDVWNEMQFWKTRIIELPMYILLEGKHFTSYKGKITEKTPGYVVVLVRYYLFCAAASLFQIARPQAMFS